MPLWLCLVGAAAGVSLFACVVVVGVCLCLLLAVSWLSLLLVAGVFSVCCVCLCSHMAVTARVCRVARMSVVARVRVEETSPHIYVVWFTHVVVDGPVMGCYAIGVG